VLRFADDGTFSIDAGCPIAQGQYEVEEATIVFSGVTTVTDVCPAEPRSIEVATTVLSDGVNELDIFTNRLTLMRGDVGLVFYGD
jgi:heat shock protein HslJ